jgi:hypothetical protein
MARQESGANGSPNRRSVRSTPAQVPDWVHIRKVTGSSPVLPTQTNRCPSESFVERSGRAAVFGQYSRELPRSQQLLALRANRCQYGPYSVFNLNNSPTVDLTARFIQRAYRWRKPAAVRSTEVESRSTASSHKVYAYRHSLEVVLRSNPL